MAARHSTLSVTQSEIQAVVNDVKVLSIKPSGIVGIAPSATGSLGAITHLTGCPAVAYSILKLGNLFTLDFAGTGAGYHALTPDGGATHDLATTTPIPANCRPSSPQYGRCLILQHTTLGDVYTTMIGMVVLNVDGIISFDAAGTGVYSGWVCAAPSAVQLGIPPFTFTYVLD
jgi:hypothetical protein